MSAKSNKQIVRSFFNAGNSGDMDACFALIADDIKWIVLGTTPLSGTYLGKQALMEKLLGPLFGRLKAGINMDVHQLVAEDDLVVAHARGKAETHEGRAYNNTYCWIIRLDNGKFVELTEFADTALIDSVFG